MLQEQAFMGEFLISRCPENGAAQGISERLFPIRARESQGMQQSRETKRACKHLGARTLLSGSVFVQHLMEQGPDPRLGLPVLSQYTQ